MVRNTREVRVAKLDLVMFEEEYKLLQEIISRLQVLLAVFVRSQSTP